MQTPVIAAILAVYVLLALFWIRAARRVASGDRRVAHVIGLPGLLGAGPAFVAAVLFGTQLLLALVLAALALVYLGVVLWLSLRMYRAARPPAPVESRLQAMAAPFVEHMALLVGLLLIGGLVAAVALVVSAISQPG